MFDFVHFSRTQMFDMHDVSGVDSTSFPIIGYLFLDAINPSALYVQTDQPMSVKHNTYILKP